MATGSYCFRVANPIRGILYCSFEYHFGFSKKSYLRPTFEISDHIFSAKSNVIYSGHFVNN